MTRYSLRGIACILVLLALPTHADSPAAAASQEQTIEFGFSRFFRGRIPLEEFLRLQPAMQIKETGWSRNPTRWYEPQLTTYASAVPDILLITAGRYSEDTRHLVERRLIAPVDSLLGELGVSAEDFQPGALDPFQQNGKLWAIPHHAVVPMLKYDRSLFASGTPPRAESWEGLLAAGAPLLARKGDAGPTCVLNVPFTLPRFAEFMALTAGAEPLSLARPETLKQPLFKQALQLALDAHKRGAVQFRQMHRVATPAWRAVFVMDYVDSLYPDTAFGILSAPAKLTDNATEPPRSRIPGFVEGLAVRSGPAPNAAARLEFLRWFLAPETEWRVHDLSNQRAPAQEWLMDDVHLPLRPKLLDSIDFDYAKKKFPEFEVLRHELARAWFPAEVAPLDYRAWELVEAAFDYPDEDASLDAVLEKLRVDIAELVRTTPVESVAYKDY